MTTPQHLKQNEFAKRLNVSAARVSQMKKLGMIVMKGKMIDVAASEALIAATKSPGYDTVREYHAEKREEAAKNAESGANGNGAGRPPKDPDTAGLTYQKARAMNEIERLKAARRENELADGKLGVMEDVTMAAADAATVLRNRLENLPDALAAQCAVETDETRVNTLLRDAFESLLAEISRQFAKLGGKNEQ